MDSNACRAGEVERNARWDNDFLSCAARSFKTLQLVAFRSGAIWVCRFRDGLARAAVLPQLKVDRLCSVVGGTADFDPKPTLTVPLQAR